MIFIIGICIITVLLILILSKTSTALTALILVPIIGSLLAGFSLEATTGFAVEGIKSIAPVAAMFIFAILFFGVLTDAGMFDPIINGILKAVGQDPAKITVGAALLAMIVHLDGSGAVTFLITIPALLPLFTKLGMDRRILACVVSLGAGTMNIVPWGGPTLRAATALKVEVTDLYAPIFIPQLGGLLFVLLIAFLLGKKEAKRLKVNIHDDVTVLHQLDLSDAEKKNRRPHLFWLNIILTVFTITALILSWMPPVIIFMLGTILALLVNYPDTAQQRERINAHAQAALLMAAILIAAGVFTGIMKDGGFIEEMAEKAVHLVPKSGGPFIPIVLAILSMPLSLVFDPDSFYFGVLPIIVEMGNNLGVEPTAIGQAAILGQMTTGFPLSPLTASTFLLTGLTNIELGDHQRFTFLYAFLVTLVMTAIAVFMGILI